MFDWFKNTSDLASAISLKGVQSRAHVRSQQAHVDNITEYLAWRDKRNGFGEDFEFTLTNRREDDADD